MKKIDSAWVWVAVAWAWSRSRGPSSAPRPLEVVPSSSGSALLEDVWPYTLPERKRRWTLDGLHEDAAEHFRALVAQAKALGLEPRIADATRSPREQREERWSRSSKVDCSWHLGGRALDIEIKGKGVQWDPDYEALGDYWEQTHKGGKWGGHFSGYGEHGDFRHFEFAPDMGYPKQHGLCDTDYQGVRAYWKKSKANAA